MLTSADLLKLIALFKVHFRNLLYGVDQDQQAVVISSMIADCQQAGVRTAEDLMDDYKAFRRAYEERPRDADWRAFRRFMAERHGKTSRSYGLRRRPEDECYYCGDTGLVPVPCPLRPEAGGGGKPQPDNAGFSPPRLWTNSRVYQFGVACKCSRGGRWLGDSALSSGWRELRDKCLRWYQHQSVQELGPAAACSRYLRRCHEAREGPGHTSQPATDGAAQPFGEVLSDAV